MTATREPLDTRRPHESLEIAFGNMVFSLGIGRYPDGRLAEVFIRAGKDGTQIAAFSQEVAVLLSLLLQHGVSLETISGALPIGEMGEPIGLAGTLLETIGPNRVATDAVDLGNDGEVRP